VSCAEFIVVLEGSCDYGSRVEESPRVAARRKKRTTRHARLTRTVLHAFRAQQRRTRTRKVHAIGAFVVSSMLTVSATIVLAIHPRKAGARVE
jgi:hypothetical protein